MVVLFMRILSELARFFNVAQSVGYVLIIRMEHKYKLRPRQILSTISSLFPAQVPQYQFQVPS